jgi:hypothetical protein
LQLRTTIKPTLAPTGAVIEKFPARYRMLKNRAPCFGLGELGKHDSLCKGASSSLVHRAIPYPFREVLIRAAAGGDGKHHLHDLGLGRLQRVPIRLFPSRVRSQWLPPPRAYSLQPTVYSLRGQPDRSHTPRGKTLARSSVTVWLRPWPR